MADIDPNVITDNENQPGNNFSRRITLTENDVIKGLTQQGVADPPGIMVKGPFDNNPWSIKLREQAPASAQVIMEATYDLDYLELDIDIQVAGDPVRTFTDAAPTWENVFTQDLVGLGVALQRVDWATQGLSKAQAPTAVRFRFGTSGKEVRIEIEEGIL